MGVEVATVGGFIGIAALFGYLGFNLIDSRDPQAKEKLDRFKFLQLLMVYASMTFTLIAAFAINNINVAAGNSLLDPLGHSAIVITLIIISAALFVYVVGLFVEVIQMIIKSTKRR